MTKGHFPPILYIAFCSAAATIFGFNSISVATPSLAYTLSADINDIAIATTVYLLAEILSMCSIPVWLRLAGPAKLLKYGCIGFFLSSLACLFSPTLDMLIASRLIQGLFGGLLLPLPLIFVQRFLHRDLQYEGMNRYGLSTIILPVLAPLITLSLPPEHVQWAFLVVALLALPGCFVQQGEEHTSTSTTSSIKAGNIISFSTLVFGVGVLVWSIEHHQDWGGFSSATTQLLLLAGATLLSCGLIWQTRYQDPLLEWRIFLHARAAAVIFMSLLSGAIVYGLIYLIPLYAVMVHSAAPSTVFLIVVTAAVPQIVLYPVLSKFKYKLIPHLSVATGFFLLASTAWFFSSTGIDFGPGDMWQVQLPRAMAILMLALPFNALLLAATPEGLETGMGVVYNFTRTLGGAISITFVNAYIVYRTGTYQQETMAYAASYGNTQQYTALAFNDAFAVLSILLAIAGTLALTLKPRTTQQTLRPPA